MCMRTACRRCQYRMPAVILSLSPAPYQSSEHWHIIFHSSTYARCRLRAWACTRWTVAAVIAGKKSGKRKMNMKRYYCAFRSMCSRLSKYIRRIYRMVDIYHTSRLQVLPRIVSCYCFRAGALHSNIALISKPERRMCSSRRGWRSLSNEMMGWRRSGANDATTTQVPWI